MPPPRRKPSSSSSLSLRSVVFFVCFGCALCAWLRFYANSVAQSAGGRVMTVAEFDRLADPVRQSQHLVGTASPSTSQRSEPTDKGRWGDVFEDGAVPAARMSAAPAVRKHELHVRVAPQPVLTPLLEEDPPVDAPETCHARAHTELEGGVVKWGDHNRVASAAECCESCRANAERATEERSKCNVWVFCADKQLCGDRFGQCWLKHAADPADPPSRGSGPSIPWTSGTVLPQPAETYRIAARMRRDPPEGGAVDARGGRALCGPAERDGDDRAADAQVHDPAAL